MATVLDLHGLALVWLDATVAALETTPAGAPDRAYVAPGQPAIDCEQAVVWVQSLGESALLVGGGAEARAKAINRGGLAKMAITIQVVRCIPQPTVASSHITLPSPGDLQDAAQMIDSDGWALWLGLNYALKHGELHEQCGGAERLGGEKLIPQGGFGGWTFVYRQALDGGVINGT